MFVLAKEPRFTWPVRVLVPVDGGTHEVKTFQACFRLITPARAAELGSDGRALMREALIGWEGITHEGGGIVQFTAEARDQLLDVPYVLTALCEAFTGAITGKAAEKN